MALTLSVLQYSGPNNPDRVFLEVGFSGNYVTGGDTLNLNPSTFLDPNGVGVLGYPDQVPVVTPSVFSTDLGASQNYYGKITLGDTLGTAKLQWFDGADELAAAAYPAGFLNGSAVIEVVF